MEPVTCPLGIAIGRLVAGFAAGDAIRCGATNAVPG
jgi:hypothetical protein